MNHHQRGGTRILLRRRSLTWRSIASSVSSESGPIRRTAARNSRPVNGRLKCSLMTSENDWPPRLSRPRVTAVRQSLSSGGPPPARATSSCLIRSTLNFCALATILSSASSKSNEVAFEKRV